MKKRRKGLLGAKSTCTRAEAGRQVQKWRVVHCDWTTGAWRGGSRRGTRGQGCGHGRADLTGRAPLALSLLKVWKPKVIDSIMDYSRQLWRSMTKSDQKWALLRHQAPVLGNLCEWSCLSLGCLPSSPLKCLSHHSSPCTSDSTSVSAYVYYTAAVFITISLLHCLGLGGFHGDSGASQCGPGGCIS